MAGPRKTLVAPILVITVGVAWLLMTLQVIAPVNWVWTLGLAVAGIVTLVGSGVDRLTIVAGPLNYLGVNPKVKCKDVDAPEPSR